MATPWLVGLGAGIAGSATSTMILAPFNSWIGPSMSGGQRNAAYWNNEQHPNILPGPEQLIQLWQTRRISGETLMWALSKSGIAPHAPEPYGNERRWSGVWEATMDAAEQLPSIDMVMRAMATNHYPPEVVPQMLRRLGCEPNRWLALGEMYWEVVPVGELMVARNRGIIGPDEWREQLHRHGYARGRDRWILDQLREVYPPITDLLRFSRREAFVPDLAARLGFYDEYPALLQPWLDKQGMYGGPGFRILRDGRDVQATWLDMYNAAEWQPLSPTQLYIMMQRLRPGRHLHFSRQLSQLVGEQVTFNPVTIRTVQDWLKINDYPASVRNWLAAIAFNPLRLLDITQALTLATRAATDERIAERIGPAINEQILPDPRAWAIEQFLDRGLSPDDAGIAADLAVERARDTETGWLRTYERGAIRRAIASNLRGYRTGWHPHHEARAALITMGLREPVADALLAMEDARNTDDEMRSMISGIRAGYTAGELSREEAMQGLLRGGIFQRRADALLNNWEFRRTSRRKLVSTSQLLRLLTAGAITPGQAAARMTRLGWRRPDMVLLIREARGKLDSLRAKGIQAAEKQRMQAAKQLRQTIKETQQLQRQLLVELKKLTPPGLLFRWLKAGVLSEDTFRSRMAGIRIPDEVVQLYIEEWHKAKEKKDGKTEEIPAIGK